MQWHNASMYKSYSFQHSFVVRLIMTYSMLAITSRYLWPRFFVCVDTPKTFFRRLILLIGSPLVSCVCLPPTSYCFQQGAFLSLMHFCKILCFLRFLTKLAKTTRPLVIIECHGLILGYQREYSRFFFFHPTVWSLVPSF